MTEPVIAGRVQTGSVIRPVRLSDARAVQGFWHAIVQENLPTLPLLTRSPSVEQCKQEIRACAERSNSTWLLAFRRGAMVGNLRFIGHPEPARRHAGVLGMAVSCAFRGAGVGSELLTALVRWAPTAQVRRLELEVFASNTRAMRLYEAHGYVREGRRQGAVIVQGQPLDLIEMARFVG